MPGRISLICITVVLFLGAAFYGFGYHITNYADQYFANTYNCSREIAMLNWEKAGQDDSRLIYAIRTCYMEPKSRLPYNLNDPNRQHYAQGGQDEFIDNVLNHKVSEISKFVVHVYPSKWKGKQ